MERTVFRTMELIDGDPIVVPKKLIKIFGLEATALLSELCSMSSANGDRAFSYKISDLSREVGISERSVRASMKALVETGFLTVSRRGIPRKNFYTLNKDAFCSLLA